MASSLGISPSKRPRSIGTESREDRLFTNYSGTDTGSGPHFMMHHLDWAEEEYLFDSLRADVFFLIAQKGLAGKLC